MCCVRVYLIVFFAELQEEEKNKKKDAKKKDKKEKKKEEKKGKKGKGKGKKDVSYYADVSCVYCFEPDLFAKCSSFASKLDAVVSKFGD